MEVAFMRVRATRIETIVEHGGDTFFRYEECNQFPAHTSATILITDSEPFIVPGDVHGEQEDLQEDKKITEKDKRMAQLEKEIARLENENSKLKRDSAEYESGLAAFSGTSRFATEFSSLSRNVPSDTNKRPLSQKPEDNLANALQSKGNPENGNRKKKLRMRLMKSRKRDNKK